MEQIEQRIQLCKGCGKQFFLSVGIMFGFVGFVFTLFRSKEGKDE